MKNNQKTSHYLLRTFVALLYTGAIFAAGFWSAQYTKQIKRFFFAPTVSVLMSTYNRADALPIAIESILNQTFPDFEFIIINDGSSDNTDEIIRSYAQKDDRIVYLKNNENKGLIYSLNRGLDKARGRYIARMDDDDKSVPFRLERQVKAMNAYPSVDIMGTNIIGKDTVPQKKEGVPVIESPDKMEINSYFSSALAHPTIIIRRSFLERYHLRYNPEYLYAEDCGLYKDVLNNGGKISALNEGLLHFGYVPGLPHPEKYGYIQGETFKKIQKEKLSAFFDAPYEMLGAFKSVENKCEILKRMVPVNKEKKILNQKILEAMQAEVCAKAIDMENAISIEHPYWTDHIVVRDDGTFFRLDARSEKGKIQKNDDQTVILDWNGWEPEIYRIKDDKHYIYLKDVSGQVKKQRD